MVTDRSAVDGPDTGAVAPDMARLTVAVLTYRRPDQLRSCLTAAQDQVEALNRAGRGVLAEVLVVDNDPEASARDTAQMFAARGLRYVLEPRPGITAGRNRALSESSASAALVFLDDDETPQDRWLETLVDTWRATGAAAVMGRVYSHLPADTDPWVVAGGFFTRPRRPTGTVLPTAATGNLLLDLDQVRAFGLRFDERLGLSGGEDTLFTRQLSRCGGTLVWCDESVADDYVQPDRATRQWVLTRAWRVGLTSTTVDIYLAESRAGRLRARLRGLVRGSTRVVGGTLRAALGILIRSARHDARGRRTARRGRGMISAALGVRYDEYARS